MTNFRKVELCLEKCLTYPDPDVLDTSLFGYALISKARVDICKRLFEN